MFAEPQQEHHWLQKMVGQWTYEHECHGEPGQPASKAQGKETIRSLGGLWIVGESQGQMPGGGEATMILTLGYDPARKKYVGTWVGSMMTHLWVYEGSLDAAGKVLTLDCEGPSFSGDGTISKYQDIITFISDEHRTLTSRVLGDNGQWNQFMEAHYRRVK